MRIHVATATLGTLRTLGALGALAVLAAGCSGDRDDDGTGSVTEPTEDVTETLGAAEPVAPGGVAVSPGGVTTRVEVPPAAEESQFGQSCLAATRWMAEQGGDPLTLVEPYLELVQQPGFTDPGNFNIPWVELTPGQQAGVILAVTTAAEGGCG